MELKIIRGVTGKGREVLEITNGNTKIAVGFGEEIGTGDIEENNNPGIYGLTCGEPSYDGIFVLRNPENCNIVNFGLSNIPIYVGQKLKNYWDIYSNFSKHEIKSNIVEIEEETPTIIKDIEITVFLIDPSNLNTYMMYFKDKNSGKSVLVSGDFRNYDGEYEKEKLDEIIEAIRTTDYLIIEGKYFGKVGPEYTSGKGLIDNLKNIMKHYKQTFIIQSETDTITTTNMYEAAKKAKRNFVETSYLCNITTTLNGSAPNPITSKKVYSYSPVNSENETFEFKRKYIIPFYISNAINKMKKEKYVMNINKDMLQDLQLLRKEGSFYDACVIYAQWNGFIEKDRDLERFINELKNLDVDYYESYTHGQINTNILQEINSKLNPRAVVLIDFKEIAKKNFLGFNNLRLLGIDENLKF